MEKQIYGTKSDLSVSNIGKTSLQLKFSGKLYIIWSLTPKSGLIF